MVWRERFLPNTSTHDINFGDHWELVNLPCATNCYKYWVNSCIDTSDYSGNLATTPTSPYRPYTIGTPCTECPGRCVNNACCKYSMHNLSKMNDGVSPTGFMAWEFHTGIAVFSWWYITRSNLRQLNQPSVIITHGLNGTILMWWIMLYNLSVDVYYFFAALCWVTKHVKAISNRG